MSISSNLIKELEENYKVDLVFSNIKSKEFQARIYFTEEDYNLWMEIRNESILGAKKGNSNTQASRAD